MSDPFSNPFEQQDALFWDRRRPRLHSSPLMPHKRRRQARTPAVPEERALLFDGVTKMGLL